jgi:hypothetical protein
LLVEGPLLRETSLGALLHEVRVSAVVGHRRQVLQVQHMIHDAIQKGAVVRDDQDRLRRLSQVLFQPARRFQIQMVRGLVEQHHVGRDHQLPRQRHAAAFAAAQVRQRFASRLRRVETESLEHCVHP